MRTFGIIGYPLGHSFSKKYFTEKFRAENITDAVFENFPLEAIASLPGTIAAYPNLRGLAVTIPYKKSVLSFLNETTDAVKETGACNCIKRSNDGKLTGYNTDVVGFELSFVKQLAAHHTSALVLGTGGAAAAVEWVLKKLRLPYQLVSRNKGNGLITYNDLTQDLMQQHKVIINTTPLGTHPNINEAPPVPYEYISNLHYCFDLIYNPPVTRFLQQAAAQGAITVNGYEMLVLQAEANWKIWNDD